ncbi:glycosyltransferase family 39 protein [Candidatus Marsarchaeota archaeon]|nr:glycosyltransferase family 39 protein [Candidatus Marsarchaeota archaeon]
MFEFTVIKSTQRIFFDDVIYQSQALYLIRTGQAVMCNYGTPFQCFTDYMFHEPIGTAFNIAIGYTVFGVNQAAAYNVQLALAAICIVIVFFISFLLFKDHNAALFSAIFFALSPTLLVWAKPVTSDLEMMFYASLSIFFMIVFTYRKNIKTLSAFAFSVVLLAYMKINALIYILLLPMLFIIIDGEGIAKSVKDSLHRIVMFFKSNNTANMLLILFLVIGLMPEIFFSYSELRSAPFGYENAQVQYSCGVGAIVPHSKFSTQYLIANLCANLYFWADKFKSQGIFQPVLFTAFSILGAAMMAVYKKREFFMIAVWFLAIFISYTAFYAGAVTYGSDWRFMLGVIAQASIFAGFGAARILKFVRYLMR